MGEVRRWRGGGFGIEWVGGFGGSRERMEEG